MSMRHYHECYGVMAESCGCFLASMGPVGSHSARAAIATIGSHCGALGCSYGHTQGAPKVRRGATWPLWVLWGDIASTLPLGQEPCVWVLINLLLFRGET